MSSTILVIGGGPVGVCCAYSLARAGAARDPHREGGRGLPLGQRRARQLRARRRRRRCRWRRPACLPAGMRWMLEELEPPFRVDASTRARPWRAGFGCFALRARPPAASPGCHPCASCTSPAQPCTMSSEEKRTARAGATIATGCSRSARRALVWRGWRSMCVRPAAAGSMRRNLRPPPYTSAFQG